MSIYTYLIHKIKYFDIFSLILFIKCCTNKFLSIFLSYQKLINLENQIIQQLNR